MAHRIGSIVAAAPLLWMSWALFRLWVKPDTVADAESWVRFGVALMLLEFVLLHSGVFLAGAAAGVESKPKRFLAFAGLFAFYGLFVVGFALGTSSRIVLQIYGFVMLGRFVSVIADAGAGAAALVARSVLGVLVYLPLVFSTVFFPWPRFGIVGELADAARTEGSSGIWVDHPHRVIGAGAVYFLAMGLFEAYSALHPKAGGPGAGPLGKT